MDSGSNEKVCYKGIDGDCMSEGAKCNPSRKETENQSDLMEYSQNILQEKGREAIDMERGNKSEQKRTKEEEEMLKHLEKLKIAEENRLVK